MPSIVATPGASNANSYCDKAYADSYFSTRVGSSAWDSDDAEIALIQATRIIDSTFSFYGYVEEDSLQALRWPRTDVLDRDGRTVSSSVVPDPVKQATCELALYIIASGGYSAEVDDMKSVRVGPIRVDSSTASTSYSVPSIVQELLSGYATFSGTIGGSAIRTVPVYRS